MHYKAVVQQRAPAEEEAVEIPKGNISSVRPSLVHRQVHFHTLDGADKFISILLIADEYSTNKAFGSSYPKQTCHKVDRTVVVSDLTCSEL